MTKEGKPEQARWPALLLLLLLFPLAASEVGVTFLPSFGLSFFCQREREKEICVCVCWGMARHFLPSFHVLFLVKIISPCLLLKYLIDIVMKT